MTVLRWIGITVALAVSIAFAAGAGLVTARGMLSEGEALPGATVRPFELGGDDVVVSVARRELTFSPGQFLRLDDAATERARQERGQNSYPTRVRAFLDPSPPRLWVEPVLVAREAGAEQPIVRQLQRPHPARVVTKGGAFSVVASRRGQTVDVPKLVELMRAAALGGPRAFAAPVIDVDPIYTTALAEEAAAEAEELVAEPVALRFHGKNVGTLAPETLTRLARFTPRKGRFVVTFDGDGLARTLRPALAQWRSRATNARFVLDGTRIRVVPSKPGLEVSPSAALASVQDALGSTRRIAELGLRETRADLTTKEAQALGIRQRISTFTTEMGPSSANRIWNVQLMARYIDGTLIRPGEVFSFNGSVGPRTVERGFREGQMIIGSLLVPSIGGGVCQTATTLFNNAWELGLPILARQNHSFYISHYPLGRDAAVSWGGPDFSFRNDLKTGILIKTTYTSSTLTFSFYGTDPKRKVITAEGPKVNWRTPSTTYAFDPYAPAGSVRTVSGSNQSGFDVTVARTIYERGKLLRRDSVTSNYVAVGPTQIYGPGRSIPGPYFTLPRF